MRSRGLGAGLIVRRRMERSYRAHWSDVQRGSAFDLRCGAGDRGNEMSSDSYDSYVAAAIPGVALR